MKILHTADWHFGTFRSPVRDGVNLRTEDTKRCMDELIRVARLAPQGIVAGVISAMLIGLPVFWYGNIKGIAICKTAGSLLTVILSGAVALAVTRKRGEAHG